MISIKELYLKYKKPQVDKVKLDPWGRFINIISIPITRFLLGTRITPNQVTYFWTVLGIIGGLFFIPGTVKYNIIGAVILNISWVFDAVDGTMARVRKICSPMGFYLESLGHWLSTVFMGMGIAIGAYNKTKEINILILGFLFCISILLFHLLTREKIHIYLKEGMYKKKAKESNPIKISKQENKSLVQRIYDIALHFYQGDFFFLIIIPLSLLNMVEYLVIFYGITFPILILLLYIYEVKRGFEWVDGLHK